MAGLPGRTTPLAAVLAAGALAAALVPLSVAAERSSDLRSETAGLERRANTVLLELYAFESSLSRARAEAARVQTALDDVARREAAIRRRTGIMRRSLAAAQARVAAVVRRLYVDGDADPIALVLGAGSVGEALAGIDSLKRVAERNRVLASDLRTSLARLRTLDGELAARRRELELARMRARAAEAALVANVEERSAYLAALRRQGALTRTRIESLTKRARTAERHSARLAAPRPLTALAEAAVATAADDGTRAVVVEAVAYHLPGTTASGLPVGPGVVAVDPAVIPLGTRMFVPGYGAAVAADVGSAITGFMIDLWFPTTAEALDWGRRSVTITLYG